MANRHKKVIVRLMGGLGNQMFQFAAGYHYALKFDRKLYIDTSLLGQTPAHPLEVQRDFELRHLFSGSFDAAPKKLTDHLYPQSKKIAHRLSSKIKRIMQPGDVLLQEDHNFIELVNSEKEIVGLVGRFQNEIYFKDSLDYILDEFHFKKELSDLSAQLIEQISDRKSVVIHVRRGDYITHPTYSQTIGFVGENYLIRAMEYFKQCINCPRFFVFSDDPTWCISFFGEQATIVRETYLNNPAHSDFQLMTRAKNLIISNSTFGWWCGRIAESKGARIVAPRKWSVSASASDKIVPNRWSKI